MGAWFLATHLLCSDGMLVQPYAVCSIFFTGLRIVSVRPKDTKLSFFFLKKDLLMWVNYIASISLLL